VRVDAAGTVTNVSGDIAGVQVGAFDKDGVWKKADVKDVPFADWELAPVLPRDAYAPANAKDRPDYVHPSDRLEKVEKVAGDALPGTKPAPAKYNNNGPRSTYRPRVFGL
jgi:hypothetical protein